MQVSQQIWKCATGAAERVYGLGAIRDKGNQPLLYCAEHAGLCRHEYVRNQQAEYIEHKQGTIVVDTVQ